MDETNNCLEILINLIYLARHTGDYAEAADCYLAEAEKQAMRLVNREGAMTSTS